MSFRCQKIVIVSAARTPIGAFLGSLASLSSPQLGAESIKGCLAKAGLSSGDISETIMGCVLPAGCGQAPARQTAIRAGIPVQTPATTINKVCGSGMKAVMLGCAQLMTGEADCVLAGGMESMSNAPYLQEKLRSGLRLGHGIIKDHMFTDGLEDAYSGQLMGVFAEQVARHYGITREAMDAYALESLSRVKQAKAGGLLDNEIVAIKTEKSTIKTDEQPEKAQPEKISRLKPAFDKKGSVTAANSSSISDGAAALLLMGEDEAMAAGITPLARICGYFSYAGEPAEFTLAPIHAINGLLNQVGWDHAGVDLYEINEAFAVVALLALQELNLSHHKVNIYGGACALGHPLGVSGARIIVTLLNALEQSGGQRGIASLCIGGGEATAIAVERI
ncbi:thiolase family protein [Endozoicomonas sp. Mp262]|uniref:thiolase family protein n=1 Tax=Endozoicomonas sp. Mp262 TaxID=2919499 RepID=UPI0021DABE18